MTVYQNDIFGPISMPNLLQFTPIKEFQALWTLVDRLHVQSEGRYERI